MSEAAFSGEGFKPFPNTHADNSNVGNFSTFTTEQLEYKVNEYGHFLTREDIMPRARLLGSRVLDHALFELAYRDGIYDEFIRVNEDELCEGAA